MSKRRNAFSWGLSILAHTVLLILLIKTGYTYIMPEGDVSSDKISFETYHSPESSQTIESIAKPVEKVESKSKNKIPTVLPQKVMPAKNESPQEVEPVFQKLKSDTTAPEVMPEENEPVKVEEPPLIPKDEKPPQVAITSPYTAPAPNTPVPNPPESKPAEPTQQESPPVQNAENSNAELAQVPKFGTPGTMLDESKLEEVAGNRKPAYPWMARVRRQEGTVVIAAYIKPDGKVELPLIQKSSGFPLLDREAVSAYSQWRYKPQNSGWVIKSFIFKLVEK